ncbi:1938_t:CDS:2 [Funneliformis mosseae]|uniref:1938_t:CDS:1 n=1 Tax=Funneliformis mosseae TaxID=27381 RepID=A0A9N9EID8_FUNMO|nr:1938_t:CDS:2 [Funneliformis mosseae]
MLISKIFIPEINFQACPSEIHANDTEVFQLKTLSLNFLRNTSEITDEYIPKLNPYHFCDEGILALPLHSFTELILASGEYHMVFKDKDFRKKDPLSDDTVGNELELLLDLGLIDDEFLANQEKKITKIITHD